jgi:exonuclease SbcC
MIPCSIQIKNFLSYGSPPQTISFEPYHLIYLCGKNGHGKSALLDAITWALWGHARKVHTSGKPDQGLMRIGSQHMAVVFDWIVHNQRHRVRREVILQPSKTVVNLDFGIVNELGAFKPLTDKTIRATQERINTTIGLDYDGFIASAFIRQGNSHEFSRRAPQERKDLLAQILGIGTYETIRKKALAELRELENSRERCTTQETLYANAPDQLVSIDTRLTECETLRSSHLNAIADCSTKRDYLSQAHRVLVTELAELGAHARALDLQAAPMDHEISALKNLLAQRTLHGSAETAHHQLAAEYAATRAHEGALRDAYAQAQTAREQLLAYEQEYLNERNGLKESYFSEHNALSLAKELLAARRKSYTEERDRHEATQITTITELQVATHKHRAERAHRSYEWCRAERLIYTARSTFAITPETTECPTCAQPVTEAHAAGMSARHEKIVRRGERLAWYEPVFESRATRTREAYSTAQNQYTTYCAWHADATRLQETALLLSADERQNAHEMSTLKDRYAELARVLEATHAARTTPLKNIVVQAPDHSALLNAESARRSAEERLITISAQSASHRRATIRSEIMASIRTIRAYKNARQQAIPIRAAIAHKELTHREIEQQLEKLNIDTNTFEKALREAERELGSLYALKEKAIAEKELLQKARAEREALDNKIALYRGAISVLSKDGIPALLIEEALPELENAANDLLGRLTDNQSHLRFESLRDLKNGGTRETLDIIISDALGTRPYEMFSGGEAFRIDFALRVALSQLLARRVGTTLQTLIIDEGFGSQDEEGLSRVMDAIYRVQDQFEKIIIVSHLPAMKDQFPVHFSVIKRPTGSFVQILEQA